MLITEKENFWTGQQQQQQMMQQQQLVMQQRQQQQLMKTTARRTVPDTWVNKTYLLLPIPLEVFS
jgi:hypothetical protein